MSRLLVVLSFANRKVLHHIIPSGGWHWTGWRKNLQADNLVEIWEHGRSVPSRGNSKCKGPELRELWLGWKHRKGQAWLEIDQWEGDWSGMSLKKLAGTRLWDNSQTPKRIWILFHMQLNVCFNRNFLATVWKKCKIRFRIRWTPRFLPGPNNPCHALWGPQDCAPYIIDVP